MKQQAPKSVAQPAKVHQPVLANDVAALWQAYFHPERDQKPLQKSRGQSHLKSKYPPIRPDLAQNASSRLLYVDATLGEAGHARLLLSQQPQAHLFGIDADAQMLERARYFLSAALGEEQCRQRCQFFCQRFLDYFSSAAPSASSRALQGDQTQTGPQADLIFFDLGISLFHYGAEAARGFSFRPENPDEILDMRLAPDSGGASAADLVQDLNETELADIFWRYAELHNSRRLARMIVKKRTELELQKAQVLADLLWQITPAKERNKSKIHPATQVFQALRIAVNDELGQLENGLPAALEQLRPYGLLAVITFHSLEDRLVKQMFRAWREEGRVQWIYKKAIQAPYDSPLSSERSAKLRVVRRMT